MTPRQAYEALGKVPGFDGKDQSEPGSHRTGRIGLDDLLAIVSHHTCRRVQASADPWGLVDLPSGMVQRRLKDEWFEKRCQKVLVKARETKPGCLLEVSLSIHPVDRVKHEAYSILLHTVGIWMGDGNLYVID